MSDRRHVWIAAVAAVVVGSLAPAVPAPAQTWRTLTSARQVWDRTPLNVHLHYGVGTLRLAAADAPMLYRMEMRFDEDQFTPVSEFDPERRTLRLGVEGREKKRGIHLGDDHHGSRASFALSREVPLDLDLDFGAGEAEIDLGGISLQRLDLSTGASETTVRFGEPNRVEAERISIEAGAADLRVLQLGNARASRIRFQGGVGSTVLDFGGAWTRDATASVKMGIGSLTLRFPRDLGVRIQRDSFLTSFDAPGMVKRGKSYYSRNWDQATRRLDVDIDAAFGSIEVEWIG